MIYIKINKYKNMEKINYKIKKQFFSKIFYLAFKKNADIYFFIIKKNSQNAEKRAKYVLTNKKLIYNKNTRGKGVLVIKA